MFARFAFAFAFLFTLPPVADARCGKVCQEKCRANPGPQSVENCIKLWGCINANYGASAYKFENSRPPAKCKHLFKPK